MRAFFAFLRMGTIVASTRSLVQDQRTIEVDMAKRIDAEDAKQAKQGYPLLAILTVSLGMAALVWLAVEVYGQLIASGM
jgi:hypothetical protein